jgi:hypothetical protein
MEPTVDMVEVNGKALYSFTPNHFMLQTDKYIYKVTKEGLSAATRAILDESSMQNKRAFTLVFHAQLLNTCGPIDPINHKRTAQKNINNLPQK